MVELGTHFATERAKLETLHLQACQSPGAPRLLDEPGRIIAAAQ